MNSEKLWSQLIAAAFNTKIGKLRVPTSGISSTATELNLGAGQVTVSMGVMRESAAHQSDAASSTASALELVSVSVGQIAEHAREADAASPETDLWRGRELLPLSTQQQVCAKLPAPTNRATVSPWWRTKCANWRNAPPRPRQKSPGSSTA